MIRIVQINIDRRRAAQDLLFQSAAKGDSDLMIVSEPNKDMARKPGSQMLQRMCVLLEETRLLSSLNRVVVTDLCG